MNDDREMKEMRGEIVRSLLTLCEGNANKLAIRVLSLRALRNIMQGDPEALLAAGAQKPGRLKGVVPTAEEQETLDRMSRDRMEREAVERLRRNA